MFELSHEIAALHPEAATRNFHPARISSRKSAELCQARLHHNPLALLGDRFAAIRERLAQEVTQSAASTSDTPSATTERTT